MNATERAFPLGFIGAKDDKRWGANKGGVMRDGAIISDEAVTGGEVVKEGVSFEVELEGWVA